MKIWVRQNFTAIEWLIGLSVSLLAVLAWLTGHNIGVKLTLADVFPVLGLVAFSLMWSHYTLGAVRRWSGRERQENDIYWAISSALVLCLIILHPLLLNATLIEAGFGLPLGSYFIAYGQTDGWFVVLGTCALIIFLLFELRHWYRKKSWWKWIDRAQVVAVVAIFIHGTQLGAETVSKWYGVMWWGMALTLLFAWVYNWKYDKAHEPRR